MSSTDDGSTSFGSRAPLDALLDAPLDAPLGAQLDAADLGHRKQVTVVYPSPTKEPTLEADADVDADAVLRSGVLGAYAHAMSPKQPAE